MQSIQDVENSWKPLQTFGFENPFWNIEKTTVIHTWAALAALVTLCLLGRYFLTKKKSVGRYLAISFCESFVDLVDQTLGTFSYSHFVMVTGIFSFILLCNWIALIPAIEEPTSNLNTTLALGIVVFAYKEFYAIKINGIKAYINEFMHPFFVMFPLNVIGHFSKIISMSFRLYGNIFGGYIITDIYATFLSQSIWWQLIGLFSGLNIVMLIFFTLFEGLIQAFVFAMLSLTYLAIAIQEE